MNRQLQMTEQTFHIAGLDPRSALCGRTGRIWSDTRWPEGDDMRAGLFVRCKDCDELFTPAVETALEKARNLEHATACNLERAALAAYRTGWREGYGEPARPDEPDPTATEDIERECSELGRRVGAHAARLLREARSADHHPPSAIRKTGRRSSHDNTDPMSTAAKTGSKGQKPLSEQTVRAIRRAYRPGVRLTKLQEHFGLTRTTIISVANRSTYTEYETGHNEYEPPPHIRGTRRREPPATPAWQQGQPMPIQRSDTRHLMPEAMRAIRQAIDDGEPTRRVARSFELATEAIEHLKRIP